MRKKISKNPCNHFKNEKKDIFRGCEKETKSSAFRKTKKSNETGFFCRNYITQPAVLFYQLIWTFIFYASGYNVCQQNAPWIPYQKSGRKCGRRKILEVQTKDHKTSLGPSLTVFYRFRIDRHSLEVSATVLRDILLGNAPPGGVGDARLSGHDDFAEVGHYDGRQFEPTLKPFYGPCLNGNDRGPISLGPSPYGQSHANRMVQVNSNNNG